MLAVSERIDSLNGAPDRTVWHKPVGRIVDEWQNIACSETEGINSPWAKQDVPIRLAKENEAWCTDCLDLHRQQTEAVQSRTPSQGSGGCGSRKRRAPNGGAAYGSPRTTTMPRSRPARRPRTVPDFVVKTSTATAPLLPRPAFGAAGSASQVTGAAASELIL